MKLLLHSRFYPSIGGIETVASIVAHEWVKAGVDVTVVTDVSRDQANRDSFPFPVYHRPNPWTFVRLLRNHDAFVHMNISLRAYWPLLLVRRAFIAVHHGFYVTDESGHRDWREKLKLWIAKRATENIAVSEAIAGNIGISCKIIVNPFAADVFHAGGEPARSRDLVFLGRLVTSKGADVLIQALSLLNESDLKPHLTIIGDGPEREALEALARASGLAKQVSFTGRISTGDVSGLLSEHKILIVPSIWNEGFGVVALEGIASGCVVIGSNCGGLPEAIGNCGLVVPAGDAKALAIAIQRMFTERNLMTTLRSNAPDHLARHSPSRVAQRYIAVITNALSK